MEVSKSQILRLWDVFFLGPFLIYLGAKKSNLTNLEKITVIASGVLTITYNGKNYLINRKEIELSKQGAPAEAPPKTIPIIKCVKSPCDPYSGPLMTTSPVSVLK